MRTWALWGRTKRIAIGLATVLFLAITSMTVLGILWQNTVSCMSSLSLYLYNYDQFLLILVHVMAFGSESRRYSRSGSGAFYL